MQTQDYRLKPGFKHYDGNGNRMEAGAVVQLTEAQAANLKDRFEAVGGANPTVETTARDKAIADAKGNLSLNAKEAIAKFEASEDVVALQAALDAENAKETPRTTVVSALEDRIEQLS